MPAHARRRLTLQSRPSTHSTQIDCAFQTPHKASIHQATRRLRGRTQGTVVNKLEYIVVVEPLSTEDGGGFIATVPDLPGCMSDGETPVEALQNVQDAIAAWMEAAEDVGHKIPKPSRRLALAS